MSYYLAIHEAPCVGICPVVFEADDNEQADEVAFEQSATDRNLVMGGYDLYRLHYNSAKHRYELRNAHDELDHEMSLLPHDDYRILPCDIDPFGECPKPEYARDCAKCRGWTQAEAEANATEG